MRIVLDTNILISALLSTGTPPAQLYDAWKSRAFTLLTSQVQIEELRRVLQYKKLQRYLRKEAVSRLLETISSDAEIVENLPAVEASPDPDDNAILAIALGGKADCLITGDKRDLLQLGSVGDIPIVSARDALDQLNREAGDSDGGS